ncbi:MAG: diadenylate cyclase CdaA [Bacteroidales bacterium]|nr:diadenylate cyclase CdaA [Bacteroidales bacterium]
MNIFFLNITILELIDIIVFSFILYKIYIILKDSVAINVFTTIALIYFLWILVKTFKMELLSGLLSQIINIGLIALIIVFQQEIRKALIYTGSKFFSVSIPKRIENLIKRKKETPYLKASEILKSISILSKTKTGALIVIARKMKLDSYIDTGEKLYSEITSSLLLSIFQKDTPLHDGAVIIRDNKIVAARCILPINNTANLPPHYGTRHRAALAVAEQTDAIVIVVSEENGAISIAFEGNLFYNKSIQEVKSEISKYFEIV